MKRIDPGPPGEATTARIQDIIGIERDVAFFRSIISEPGYKPSLLMEARLLNLIDLLVQGLKHERGE